MAEQPTTEIYAPRTRTWTIWTPGLLQSAEISADGGDLRYAADLGEQMFGDDRIKAVSDTRTDTLLGLELEFEAGLRARKRAPRALEAGEDWWTIFPEHELKLLHGWGLMLGVSVGQLVWRRDRISGRDVPTLKHLHPRWLRYDEDRDVWVYRARASKGSTGTVDLDVTPGDGRWVLYQPYGSSRPWMFGAWRALSRWALLKSYAISDWGSYSERHGHGILVATGARGSREERAQIAADLRNLARKAALALPEGFDMKLIEATAKTYETFVAQLQAADNGYAVTWLGQNLSTQAGNTGNQAATLHGNVALGRTKADAETLSTLAHDQVLVHWGEANFGSPDAAPWACWDAEATADEKADAEIEQMEAQATATLFGGGVITLNEARERHDLPPIDGGDVFKPASGGTSASGTSTPSDSGGSGSSSTDSTSTDTPDQGSE